MGHCLSVYSYMEQYACKVNRRWVFWYILNIDIFTAKPREYSSFSQTVSRYFPTWHTNCCHLVRFCCLLSVEQPYLDLPTLLYISNKYNNICHSSWDVRATISSKWIHWACFRLKGYGHFGPFCVSRAWLLSVIFPFVPVHTSIQSQNLMKIRLRPFTSIYGGYLDVNFESARWAHDPTMIERLWVKSEKCQTLVPPQGHCIILVKKMVK